MRRPTHRTRVRASSAEPPSTRAWEAPLPQGRGRASGVPEVPAGTQGVCPGVPGSAPQLRPPPPNAAPPPQVASRWNKSSGVEI